MTYYICLFLFYNLLRLSFLFYDLLRLSFLFYDLLRLSFLFYDLSRLSFLFYDLLRNTTGTTSEADNAYPLRAPGFTPGFEWVLVTQPLVLCVLSVDNCFSFFWLLYCLSF